MVFRRTPQSATEWIVRLHAGPLSWWDRRALARWLSARSEHLVELEAAQTLSEVARGLGESPRARTLLAEDLRALATVEPRRQGFSWAPLAVAMVAAVIVIAVEPWKSSSSPRPGDQGQTQTTVGEIADYMLPDRSQITVGGASAVSIAFTEDQRAVSLERGEAFFDVKPDADRPFIVTAGPRKVTVIGTSFNVNYLSAQNAMEVAVIEGTVHVAFPAPGISGGEATERMQAGDVFLFPAEGPSVRRNLTAQQVSAWRSRKLYFDSANLGQVLAAVNRYSVKPVVSETPEIEDLRITGQFQAGDVESVLISLQQLYGIGAEETSDRWVLKSDARR
jgi:transmembrane sensor